MRSVNDTIACSSAKTVLSGSWISHYVLYSQNVQVHGTTHGTETNFDAGLSGAWGSGALLLRLKPLNAEPASICSSASNPLEFYEYLLFTQPSALDPNISIHSPAWVTPMRKHLVLAVNMAYGQHKAYPFPG
ncbi:hypothetical protein AcW1_009030 [Taiwanofungus camphoratus]|nr:hypothetical protein AcV5_007053 [Antrodia cinnamomea]KAI0949402.1 hypothetical protein AcW1_009030 [Antrodia cinnamomea]KAI0958790.1 hypothetical protein AcV7_004500 [Antrodia cinnamomea]